MKSIKITIFFFFLFTSFYPPHPTYAEVETSLWKTEKSQHFIIYYQEAPSGYVERLINEAEKYYNSILEDLGYRRFEFWSWENRAKIYLYKDAYDYHADTQRLYWSAAAVDVKKRAIKTFVEQGFFFDSILPHEMTHIIFREFVGDKISLPLWLDEGIAGSQEKSNLNGRMRVAKNLVESSTYVDINTLSGVKDPETITPQIFYAQSASLVVFLLEQYGRDKFLDFSRWLRDSTNPVRKSSISNGANWQEALISAYRFKDLNDMQEKWKEFMVK